MKLRFLLHPVTKQQDPMLTLACVVVTICSLKFLFEGVSLTLVGHTLNLGHADAMTYGALLTPVLGAHGYLDAKKSQVKVDNPDAN